MQSAPCFAKISAISVRQNMASPVTTFPFGEGLTPSNTKAALRSSVSASTRSWPITAWTFGANTDNRTGGRPGSRRRASDGEFCRRGRSGRPGRGSAGRSTGRGRYRRRRCRVAGRAGRRWPGTASCRVGSRGRGRGRACDRARSGRCRPNWCDRREWRRQSGHQVANQPVPGAGIEYRVEHLDERLRHGTGSRTAKGAVCPTRRP